MIVVVGSPVHRALPDGAAAEGLSARIALAAAGRGSSVQLVGKIGEDPEGDAVVLALSGGHVGHVALLREGARRTPRLIDGQSADGLDEEPQPPILMPADASAPPTLEPADVDLALRYLTEFAVLVVAEPGSEILRVAVAAASWHEATLIVLLRPGDEIAVDVPDSAIVLEGPGSEAEAAFAELVGSMAARIDAGEEPGSALREVATSAGWTETRA